MKRLMTVLVGIAALIAVCVVAVQIFDDRELFTPPPDSVAEGFYREVTTKRWDRAREYLLEPDKMSDDELRDLERTIEERIGRIENVEARIGSRDDAWANVFVKVEGTRGDTPEIGTVVRWNGDEWKVSR